MDLRSVKLGLLAVSHPLFIIHPKTGEMITPIGHTANGRPIWPTMGGAPENEDSDGDKDDDTGESDDDEEDDGDSDEDSDDDEDEDEGDGGKKKGNAQAKIKALEEEKDRHFRKAKKANKRADLAEAELAALKAKYESGGKDKNDKDDKNEKPVDDSKIKAAEAAAQKLRVENAFLRVNEIAWIKPEQALALMLSDDDYEIEFDDDGKVDRKSLRAELKRFAKANPHLVKKPAAKDDEEDADEGSSSQRQTAPQMNGKRKGKTKSAPTREELAKRFPALNRLGS